MQPGKELLWHILRKAEAEAALTHEETVFLLGLTDDDHLESLFKTARRLRERYFGNRIFLYGFVYFSTWCRNNCAFCYYRSANRLSRRYRKSMSEIVATAVDLAESGVHLIDLTMGEDPYFHHNEEGVKALAAIVREVKETTGLPVMISPGVASRPMLDAFSEARADWYACYQETHNRNIFARLRLNQNYDARLDSKWHAQKAGLLVEEGLMVGINETVADIAVSMKVMKKMNVHQVRVMSYVPQEGSLMRESSSPGSLRELITISVLRLHFPDRLIPASLDVDGLSGLKERLLAGANVVTSLIPPENGLAGVAQSKMDIDEGLRSAREVFPILSNLNLHPAAPDEYRTWVDRKKETLKRGISGVPLSNI